MSGDFARSVQNLIQNAKDLEMTLKEASAALKRVDNNNTQEIKKHEKK